MKVINLADAPPAIHVVRTDTIGKHDAVVTFWRREIDYSFGDILILCINESNDMMIKCLHTPSSSYSPSVLTSKMACLSVAEFFAVYRNFDPLVVNTMRDLILNHEVFDLGVPDIDENPPLDWY